jgi:hypothetical protein
MGKGLLDEGSGTYNSGSVITKIDLFCFFFLLPNDKPHRFLSEKVNEVESFLAESLLPLSLVFCP